MQVAQTEGELHLISEDEIEVDRGENKASNQFVWLKRVVNPDVLKTSTITFTNGGDNIGVYIPFFAPYNIWNIILIVTIFLACGSMVLRRVCISSPSVNFSNFRTLRSHNSAFCFNRIRYLYSD